jgi:predicted nuclease of restriction endonuclease-like RecB superfamily
VAHSEGDSLFADLPGERLLGELTASLSPPELALRANLNLIQGLLGRATRVTLEVS